MAGAAGRWSGRAAGAAGRWSRQERAPPGGVVAVPADRGGQAGGELDLGLPAELLADLGVVEGVAEVAGFVVGRDQRAGVDAHLLGDQGEQGAFAQLDRA